MNNKKPKMLKEEAQKTKYLTFSLDNEVYGIEVSNVTEIIKIQPITKVPHLPNHIMGIINLRGKIIPVMDVRTRFNKESKEYNDRTCIIVIDFNNILLGLIVDAVIEVIKLSDNDIVSPPENKTGFTNKYIKGIGKIKEKIVLILDCNTLLQNEEIISAS